ncbi:hypothetical protein [Emcibacter nanhaiensis]|uniref:Uncharacterized protein n=1 Tax=Emcibacter nanhaiensis TaxID=1505037 RepID=A0A501PSD5_9PROT|nr:hypothetical protein [Emcibacter nanhaiensis]TPD63007.1 hypothetical protein FIV46_02705 [Emcibacter nanhaiensis]
MEISFLTIGLIGCLLTLIGFGLRDIWRGLKSISRRGGAQREGDGAGREWGYTHSLFVHLLSFVGGTGTAIIREFGPALEPKKTPGLQAKPHIPTNSEAER